MGNKRGGLLFGVIVGTLLGILFAPRKGKELRKQLKNEVSKGGMGTETLKKNFMEMGEDMATTAEGVYSRPEVQRVVSKGKKQVDKMMKTAGEHVGKAEQKIKNIGEKYLDVDDETIQDVSEKIHTASKNVQSKLKTLRQKLMGDFGFTKKPLSRNPGSSKGGTKKRRSTGASGKSRTRRVPVRKKR